MRLWSYQILDVLPDKMLIAEWRECLAIKRQWEKGTLKHRLVSYVKDYETALFYYYTVKVCEEMEKRNIKFQRNFLNEIDIFCNHKWYDNEVNYPEHNDRYLKQCYFNLQEKFDRGIISEEEWQKIYNKYKDKFDLWENK